MKRILFLILPVFALFFIASCGGGKEPQEEVLTDSLPPELAALTQQIAANPENAELYHQRALIYLEKQQHPEALTDINKAIDLNGQKPLYFRTLSDIYFTSGKVQQCRDALNKALDIDPDDTEAYLKLAELEFYFKEYKNAFDYVSRALDIEPRNAKAFFIRGMSYKEMGDTAKAVKNFQIAVENDQEYYHAFIQLGLLYAIKRNPLAAEYYKNAIKVNPASTEAYYNLGVHYQETQQYNLAIETYSDLLKIDPQFKAAHYNLGYIHLVYLQVYDVAARHFTDAINTDRNYAEAWYNRGYCYELLGDVMKAKADYKEAMSVKPNYQRAIEGLNRVDALMKR